MCRNGWNKGLVELVFSTNITSWTPCIELRTALDMPCLTRTRGARDWHVLEVEKQTKTPRPSRPNRNEPNEPTELNRVFEGGVNNLISQRMLQENREVPRRGLCG